MSRLYVAIAIALLIHVSQRGRTSTGGRGQSRRHHLTESAPCIWVGRRHLYEVEDAKLYIFHPEKFHAKLLTNNEKDL